MCPSCLRSFYFRECLPEGSLSEECLPEQSGECEKSLPMKRVRCVRCVRSVYLRSVTFIMLFFFTSGLRRVDYLRSARSVWRGGSEGSRKCIPEESEECLRGGTKLQHTLQHTLQHELPHCKTQCNKTSVCEESGKCLPSESNESLLARS